MRLIISLIAVFIFLFYFSFVKSAFASFSFNIASVSATTISSGDQEIDVNLNIADLPSESYFRVAIQKESGGSYFGYVKNNNGDWAVIQPLNGDCTIYFKVDDTSTTSLAFKVKAGQDTITDNGSYKLKAHRFTKTCTSYTEAANDFSITVNLPTPTPTPTDIPTPVATSTSAPASTPTKTPTSTPIPNTPTPTLKPSISPTKTPIPSQKVLPTFILGESTESGLFVSPTNKPSNKVKSSNNSLLKILMGVGIIFIAICAILTFRAIKKGKLTHNEEE